MARDYIVNTFRCAKHNWVYLDKCEHCLTEAVNPPKNLSKVPQGWTVRKDTLPALGCYEIVISSPDGFYAALRCAPDIPKLGSVAHGSIVDTLYRYFDAVLKEESSDESKIPRSS